MVGIFVLLIIISGCSSNKENPIENEKSEKTFDEKISNLTNSYHISKLDSKVGSKEFEEVYYIVENDNQNINLFINNDGSMFEYSNKKFLSTNSNVKKYISKLKELSPVEYRKCALW